MNIQKTILLPLLIIVSLSVAGSAYADVYSYNGINYPIPAGYQSYQGGIFYNPNTGIYLNPVTGQTSTTPLPSLGTGTYVVPQGYTLYNGDTYYNPTSGTYFNRLTGQISQYAPTNQVLPGYTYYGYGIYYNANTNTYWNSGTGQYSATLPSYVPVNNPAPTYQTYSTTPPAVSVTQIMVASPALPRTGAGGEAPFIVAILLASAAVVAGGVRYITKSALA